MQAKVLVVYFTNPELHRRLSCGEFTKSFKFLVNDKKVFKFLVFGRFLVHGRGFSSLLSFTVDRLLSDEVQE